MNKYQQELLDKCKLVKVTDDIELLDDIYILPINKKHDSGYNIMYVVGYSRKSKNYYLLDTYCDVVNFGYLRDEFKNLNVDIQHGVIHFWSNHQQLKNEFRVSSCTFDFVDKNESISKEEIKEIIYPTPENYIPIEVQTSDMYSKLQKLLKK